MLFNSMQFLIFFPVVLMICFVIPKRVRYIWLLVASYYFYMCWNVRHATLLFTTTVTTYLGGILVCQIKKRKKDVGTIQNPSGMEKMLVILCISVNLGILFIFKYFHFAMDNLNILLKCINRQPIETKFDVILPVGISFFTFQAIGYIIDVYRGEIEAEKNFLKYALFVSFFPQLVAGPIERSKNLLKQLDEPIIFQKENAREGLLTIAYGLFLKVVVADNISGIIDPIFSGYQDSEGMKLMVAIVLFAFQIYCDFQGYSQIAIGSAKMLGYRLNENFDSPYLAHSVQDFWRRWHISLTSWFRDYLYIPLGGNRKGKFRKEINTLIVFLFSGLWHGPYWHYVAWGGLNGAYLVVQDLTENIRKKLYDILHINTTSGGWKLVSGVFTFVLVDYAWLLFRTTGLRSVLIITKKMIMDFRLSYLFSDNVLGMFGNTRKVLIIFISLIIVFLIDLLKERKLDWKYLILKQQIVYRWIAYVGIVLIILFWGAYGEGYEQTQFIYFQF